MKKLSIIAIIVGTAAATALFITKAFQKEKCNKNLFDDEYDDDCCDCDSCACESELDVVIPAQDTEDNAEAPVDEAEEKAEKTAEEADSEAE